MIRFSRESSQHRCSRSERIGIYLSMRLSTSHENWSSVVSEISSGSMTIGYYDSISGNETGISWSGCKRKKTRFSQENSYMKMGISYHILVFFIKKSPIGLFLIFRDVLFATCLAVRTEEHSNCRESYKEIYQLFYHWPCPEENMYNIQISPEISTERHKSPIQATNYHKDMCNIMNPATLASEIMHHRRKIRG